MLLGRLLLAHTQRFSVWELLDAGTPLAAEAPPDCDQYLGPYSIVDMDSAFGELNHLELLAGASSGEEAVRIGRVGAPFREVKVLVTTDESVFIEELDGTGTRTWLPIALLVRTKTAVSNHLFTIFISKDDINRTPRMHDLY